MKTNSIVIEQISFIMAFEIDFITIKINSDIIRVVVSIIITTRLVNCIMMVGYCIVMVSYIIMANYIKVVDYIKMVNYIMVIIIYINLELIVLMGQLQVLLYYL